MNDTVYVPTLREQILEIVRADPLRRWTAAELCAVIAVRWDPAVFVPYKPSVAGVVCVLLNEGLLRRVALRRHRGNPANVVTAAPDDDDLST